MKNPGVSNGKIISLLSKLDKKLDEKFDDMSSQMEFQGRTSKRLEGRMTSLEFWFKKFERQIEKSMSNFEERMNEIEGATKIIVNWGAMKSDLQDFATRHDLDRMKLEIIEPIIKAVDKDAVTIVEHGKRIGTLERKTGILAK